MRIIHIAYNLGSPEDVEAARKHFENFYGMRYGGIRERRGLLTADLTDGRVFIALTHYQPHAAEAESTAAGPPPGIHHIGFDVEDFDARAQAVAQAGFELFSAPGQVPLKFRAPGGTVAEFAPAPFFTKRNDHQTPTPIKHIALRLDSREAAAAASRYYEDTWELRSVERRDRDGRYTHDLTDGNLSFAVTHHPDDAGSARIHHIGFELEDFEDRVRKIQNAGYEIVSKPGRIPFRYIAPGGTAVEFVPPPYFSERI